MGKVGEAVKYGVLPVLAGGWLYHATGSAAGAGIVTVCTLGIERLIEEAYQEIKAAREDSTEVPAAYKVPPGEFTLASEHEPRFATAKDLTSY